MRQGFPTAQPGQVIGLLGGSFDPAHAGHAHITRVALQRFGLDRVWWLVSPGNPLKTNGPASMDRRIAAAAQVMSTPRVTITGLEAELGTRYTAETIAVLRARYPRVRFVWLMGADNLMQFDRWQDWRSILDMVPVGVLARPGHGAAPLASRAARIYADRRIPSGSSYLLGRSDPVAWCHVTLPLSHESSSAIRARGEWPKSV